MSADVFKVIEERSPEVQADMLFDMFFTRGSKLPDGVREGVQRIPNNEERSEHWSRIVALCIQGIGVAPENDLRLFTVTHGDIVYELVVHIRRQVAWRQIEFIATCTLGTRRIETMRRFYRMAA